MTRDAGSRIREVIAEALAPGSLRNPDLSPSEWEVLWERARTHCLTPYLCQRWLESCVHEQLPPAMAKRFADARAQNAERNRRIARELVELCTALQRSGIRVLVLKGLSIAQQYYGDPGLRVLYDLDLMIPASEGAEALAAISRLGYEPFQVEAGARRNDLGLLWRPRKYDWDAERVFDPQRPIFVEVHTRPWEPNWHGFRVRCDPNFWDGHLTQEIAGTTLAVPSEEKLLVQLAVHYAFNALESNARLMHLLDVALLLRASSSSLDWDAVLREIEDCQVAPFCFLTLDLARKICQSEVPERVRSVIRDATPGSILRWLSAEGVEAAHAMSLYDRNRSRIYRLHWAMARDLKERMNVLLYAFLSPWYEEKGPARWTAVASRMAQRLRHLLSPPNIL